MWANGRDRVTQTALL